MNPKNSDNDGAVKMHSWVQLWHVCYIEVTNYSSVDLKPTSQEKLMSDIIILAIDSWSGSFWILGGTYYYQFVERTLYF